MASVFFFDGKSIRELRNLTSSWWMKQISIDGPEGWSRCLLDPVTLLSFFRPLQLKSGYVLRAYQYRNCNSGYGAVWALPIGAKLPEPKSTILDEPPQPVEALDDPMKAIEGDESPWSYFCASLLAREFEDFAGFGAGLSWTTHLIIDGDPWTDSRNFAHALAGQGFSSRSDGWQWLEKRPQDWSPAVFVNYSSTLVRFYAFSGFGRQRIIRFDDQYQTGSLSFQRSTKLIATGPDGIPW